MIRLNRLRHLQHAMEATDRGEWHDLGKATGVLRNWLHGHGLVEGQPWGVQTSEQRVWRGDVDLRRVRITWQGRIALAEAQKEYARHSNPTRAEQRRFTAFKEELAEAFGITGATRETPAKSATPWPWQDWLAEQWGARSFRLRVLGGRT